MLDSLPAAAADAGTAPRASSNIRHLARMEIGGGGQIVIQGSYAFVGYQKGPDGTSILDVSNPREPRIISTIRPDHPWSHSHKVRVVGDLMVVNSEMNFRGGRVEDYPDGGFRIYDIKDKSRPKLITFKKTYGKGVHRFDIDEKFAYISTEMEGFIGNILVIYDISNPSKPTEVSRWWLPGQNIAGGETPHPKGTQHRLHHGMRAGNEIYCAFWKSGVAIVDLSDLAHPATLSHYQYDPPCSEGTHTFLKVPFRVGGKAIALSTEEERSHRGADKGLPHAPFRTWDVTDPRDPKLLCTYHLPEEATPYRGDGVRFGTHQMREIVDSDCLAYVTWFAGGLRILDISNPASPIERGYFIPKPGEGQPAPLANDVAKDDRGLIFLTDKARGLDVLEFNQ